MPAITVSSGSTERILTDQQVRRLSDPDSDLRKAILYVESNDVRLVAGKDEDQARHGFPVPAGTHVTNFDPQGNEIHAYGDGSGSSTVHVHLVTDETFTIHDTSRP